MLDTSRSINSTNAFIDATVVTRPRHLPVDGRTIVINPNLTPVLLGEPPIRHLPAFSSTILVGSRVERGDSVLLIRVRDEPNVADIVRQPGWHRYADLAPGFPPETPLFRGPREEIGIVELDPALALGEEHPAGPRLFRVWVNLWFAPAGTECGIHNVHEFIEIHTQIHGYGRMQKFTAPDHAALYEDQLMSPGHTPPVPFCRTSSGGGFNYPWHQYHADSDSVWLAVEYHEEAGEW